MTTPKKITWIDGSLGGANGNTATAATPLIARLEDQARVERIFLADHPSQKRIVDALQNANGFVFSTGTYWDSWGSPMQKFLEDSTEFEASDLWLGKPAAVLVTMHSVGGKSVLSRLQGVLSTLGAMIPPMSGMVYSLANDLALKSQPAKNAHDDFRADLWQLEDLSVIAHNLIQALEGGKDWRPWPVDGGDARRRWLQPS